MKTLIKSLPFAAAMLLVGALSSNAQSNNQGWVVSKDVQKVAKKKQYKKSQQPDANVNVVSVYTPATVLSKDVQKVDNQTTTFSEGNIASKGTPNWVVSKGVHKVNRNKKGNTTNFPTEQESHIDEMAKDK